MLVFRRRQAASPTHRRRRIRKFRLLALVGVLGLLGFASFTFGLITAVAGQIPELDPAREQGIEVDGFIYADDGHTVLARLEGKQSRLLVSSAQIAPVMKHAIVDVEDKRFYEHGGIDVRGIARALWADIRGGRIVQGGSTITQQFVKNAYIHNERSIGTKLKEAALAWQLEQHWSKDRILTAYLNTIYFGNGAYGVERAAETYFGHTAAQMTIPEAALLAGIPADPTLFDPVSNPRDARDRRAIVLDDLLAQHDITHRQHDAALSAPLPRHATVPGTQGPAPYFGEYVKQQLIDRYGVARVFGGGLRVTTSIDLGLQLLARKAIQSVLTDPRGPSAALVSLDPKTGRVLVMYGGNDFRQSQFNLAVQGERQPGSSFKPFVLAAALREGISPASTFDSHLVTLYVGGRFWTVHNYEGQYLGPIDLTTATAASDNSVFAQLTNVVGPEEIVRTAHELGITSPLQNYFSIGLGAQAVNPLEMARAFGSFANGGSRVDGSVFGNRPRAIISVQNANRRTIDDNRAVQRPTPGFSLQDDEILTNLLEGVVRQGTGTLAALPDRAAAGKTGTTENYGDAWFVGYTPQLVTAVWVGYPSRLRPMLTEYHGRPVAGGTFPALIWKTFMESADSYLKLPPASFPTASIPYGVSKRATWRNGALLLDNGVCRYTFDVVYFNGQGPTKTADCKPNEVDVPSVVGETLVAAKQRLAAQPLTAALIYKPARPSQRTDIVLAQYPAQGTLSSYDKVTLVLAKSLHGLVPSVVGLSVARAEATLKRAGLDPQLRGTGPTVLRQVPAAGVAGAPGLRVTLVAASG